MGIKINGLTPKVEVEWVEEYPICPYCMKELNKLEATSKGLHTVHVMYRCPHCKKLLSVGLDIAR